MIPTKIQTRSVLFQPCPLCNKRPSLPPAPHIHTSTHALIYLAVDPRALLSHTLTHTRTHTRTHTTHTHTHTHTNTPRGASTRPFVPPGTPAPLRSAYSRWPAPGGFGIGRAPPWSPVDPTRMQGCTNGNCLGEAL